MPELPAMENFRRSIEIEALNKKIMSVAVKQDRVVRFKEAALSKAALGQPLAEATRHGKYVFVRVGSKARKTWLAFHCGMTGYFEFPDATEDEKKLAKAKLFFKFPAHEGMAFFDPRRFGHVELISSPSDFISAHNLGPDAMDITGPQLKELLSKSGKPLKAFFLDQSIMAGVGNVYGDEIAFQAKIAPIRKAKELDKAEAVRLHRTMIKIFKLAIRKNAYLDHWDMLPKSWLVHYREAGAVCPNCKGKIEAYKSGGRDGFWCPGCQH